MTFEKWTLADKVSLIQLINCSPKVHVFAILCQYRNHSRFVDDYHHIWKCNQCFLSDCSLPCKECVSSLLFYVLVSTRFLDNQRQPEGKQSSRIISWGKPQTFTFSGLTFTFVSIPVNQNVHPVFGFLCRSSHFGFSTFMYSYLYFNIFTYVSSVGVTQLVLGCRAGNIRDHLTHSKL